MKLDDLFGDRQQHRRYDHHRGFQHDPYEARPFMGSYNRRPSGYKWQYFLGILKINRKLKRLVIVVLIVILVIVIALIALLLPLIIKILDYIYQNGIQGILGAATVFLEKLWNGSGN